MRDNEYTIASRFINFHSLMEREKRILRELALLINMEAAAINSDNGIEVKLADGMPIDEFTVTFTNLSNNLLFRHCSDLRRCTYEEFTGIVNFT